MSSKDNRNEDQGVSWSEEEKEILRQNMETYPADKFTELKRYTLLLTNLPHKRLRDVATKVKYDEYCKTHPNTSWTEFCKDKNLLRPTRQIAITKGQSHSSSEDSEVEGSSIKHGKRSPPNTPMRMEHGNGYDSFEVNVSDSMQIEEHKQPFDAVDQLPQPTAITQKGKKKTKTTKKTKGRKNQANENEMITEQFVGMNVPPATQIGMGMNVMNGQTTTSSTFNVSNPTGSSAMMQEVKMEDQRQYNFQTEQEMIQEGERLLAQLEANPNAISLDVVNSFMQYYQYVVGITSTLAQPIPLPQFNAFPFSIEQVQQLQANPTLIYQTLGSYDMFGGMNNGFMVNQVNQMDAVSGMNNLNNINNNNINNINVNNMNAMGSVNGMSNMNTVNNLNNVASLNGNNNSSHP